MSSRPTRHRCRLRGPGLGLALAGICALSAPTLGETDPRYDYVLYCAGCHLETGGGKPPEVPDLRRDLNTLIHIAEGRGYLARVPGIAHTPLADAQIADLLNWMLARFYPALAFEPYTAPEVASYRKHPLLDPLRFRAELMQKGQPAVLND